MGFLSRKKKNPEPAVIEETHPLEEELQRMEEAVPERPVAVEPEPRDDFDAAAPTAGPVPDEGSSSSQAAGEDPSSAPPADGEVAMDAGFGPSPGEEVRDEAPEVEQPDEALLAPPARPSLRVEAALNGPPRTTTRTLVKGG